MDEYIGISLPLVIVNGAHASLDAKYGPYDSINHATSSIPIAVRRVGLTVGIIFLEGTVETVKDYWWKKGIEDIDLELKIDNAASTKTSQLENDADFQDGSQVTASLQVQRNALDAVDLNLQNQINTHGNQINTHESQINDHSSQIQDIVTAYIDNKGYFATLTSLQASYPTPEVGDTAYVADALSSTGYYIYNVVGGIWTASAVEAPPITVLANNYTLNGGSTKTTQEIDDSVSQLKGEVSLLEAVQSAKIKDIENVLSTANLNQSAQINVTGVSPLSLPKNAANGGMSVKLEGLTEDVGGVITHFEPTGRVRSVGKNIIDFRNAEVFKKYPSVMRINVIDGRTVWEAYANLAILYGKTLFDKFIPNTIYTIKYESKILVASGVGLSLVVEYTDGTIAPYYTASQAWETRTIITAAGKSVKLIKFTYGSSSNYTAYNINSFQIEKNTAPTPYEPYKETNLYLTAPELRSNGDIKDEIRKGANGYEFAKRVGNGTLGANGIAGGDFEGGLAGTKAAADEISLWAINNVTPISGTQDGRLSVTTVGTNGQMPMLTFPLTRLSGQYRRLSLNYKVNSGTPTLGAIYIGGSLIYPNKTFAGSGNYEYYYLSNGTEALTLYFNGMYLFDIQIDNLKDELINVVDGTSSGGSATQLSDGTILYTIATPAITPINYGGVLNSAENGTVYHEPIIADAGVYGTNLPILMTDYPIASIGEIIKHEDGVDTYLDVSAAVIAADGLSFTHPSLASGDLVLFTYAFSKESTNGNITATFYDSNVVKIDTVTGKAYRINEVVTNGVLTRTLTEV